MVTVFSLLTTPYGSRRHYLPHSLKFIDECQGTIPDAYPNDHKTCTNSRNVAMNFLSPFTGLKDFSDKDRSMSSFYSRIFNREQSIPSRLPSRIRTL
ncbi:hypothetical protein WG66_000329 [Moniliophthora roreri]|nr:hypothetical protein WG66_000329 [Moniliophthora roreri]